MSVQSKPISLGWMSFEEALVSSKFWLLITWAVAIPLILYISLFCQKKLISARDKRRVRRLRSPGTGRAKLNTCIAFINSKSGGQLGELVKTHLEPLLPTHQLFDLATVKPDEVLELWKGVKASNLRILVCGGDGTVNWVMTAVEKVFGHLPPAEMCPIAIMPLGTGNDLARSFAWGSGLSSSLITDAHAFNYLLRISQAPVKMLDRWEISLFDSHGKQYKTLPANNYLSVGIDAEIGLKFHEERMRHPERFSSQSKNKIKYALYGFEGAFEGYPLGESMSVFRLDDGTPIHINPHWKGVVFNNVAGYHGGKNFWGDSAETHAEPSSGFSGKLGPVRTDDGLLEVMALSGTLHIGLVHIAMDSALRLAQLPGVRIMVHESICIQIDGEPLRIHEGHIEMRRIGQYPMLDGSVLVGAANATLVDSLDTDGSCGSELSD
jgi:diacylglycerol kinase (ATP)